MIAEVIDKRLSEDRKTLVTWHADGLLWAWERGTSETHGVARSSGWARVDTLRLENPPEALDAFVGAVFDHEVIHRRRAHSIIYRLYPEVYKRSIASRGCIRAWGDPASTKKNYDNDIRAKRNGVKPPAEALTGAGVGPGGLGAAV